MADLARTEELFFTRAGMDKSRVERIVSEALHGADDGELYLEYRQSEAISFDDGRLRSASFDTSQGFGLRAVSGEAQGFAHASELSAAAIKRAAATVKAVRAGKGAVAAQGPNGTNRSRYADWTPLEAVPFETKVKRLAEMDAYARAKDPRVRQVSCSLTGEWQAIRIVRADGSHASDIRPL